MVVGWKGGRGEPFRIISQMNPYLILFLPLFYAQWQSKDCTDTNPLPCQQTMPPSLSPPHIIIIPAACQTPEFYTPLTNALAGLSLPHSTVLSLPSTDPAQISSLPDFSADVSTIRSAIVSILDNDDSEKGGDDVVLVMHSYGGVPGSAAVKGLGKAQREKEGKTRGVVRVIYVCSFVLDEGESMPGAGDVEKLKAMAGEGFDEVVCFSLLASFRSFKYFPLVHFDEMTSRRDYSCYPKYTLFSH